MRRTAGMGGRGRPACSAQCGNGRRARRLSPPPRLENLRDAFLDKPDLRGADRSGLDLQRVSLCDALVDEDTKLAGANLTNAKWIICRRCRDGSIGVCLQPF